MKKAKQLLSIWFLQRNDEPNYDESCGFVIIANTSDEARRIASENTGDENKDIWLDSKYSKCESIGVANPDQKVGVVIQDFLAG